MALIEFLFGSDPDLDPLQMAMRAIAVSIFTIALIRVAGRRAFGQHRPFDACLAVLLGAVLSRAVVAASPFWPTMAAGLAIVVVHRLLALACRRWPAVDDLVSGDLRELVRDGRRDEEQMRKALVTHRDLDEAVRKRTGDETVPLERAVLERDGQLTVKLARR
jgi:uncharacterized membrane protein YcaP (DUF421 family)